MSRYILRRVLQMIPVLFGLTLIIFVAVRLKGDPVMQFAQPDSTAEELAILRQAYGFDQPLWKQYAVFLGDIVQGDFGNSFR